MRAIDADRIKKRLQEHHDFYVNAYGGFKNLPLKEKARVDEITSCIAEIVNAPTLDVAPVRHSYWEEYSCSQYMGMDEEGEPKYRDGRVLVCHNYCCRRKTVVKSNYCPNCGAKMDAGQEDDSHGENTDE